MIERLEGEILETGASHLLIAIGGIGIRVQVPHGIAERARTGERGRLWTRLIVRDGEPHLYGFDGAEQRTCFDALLAVNGVGARIALGILSLLGPAELALEVERASTDRLTAVSGVGRKLASRIVLELKGRLPIGEPAAPPASVEGGSAAEADAIRALTALGYPPVESREAVRKALETVGSDPAGAGLDRLVREALVALNRR
ncbi:MAG: Holliday junction branch migration protein RuvA [Candidatus Eisenbacteria bacterium]|nr:Holliday junction branch migration protein RuvA [Candidatus Latescibacterota bacterium]MBD3301693.1 Holliday junction branch migration protein RuvA [Candidatus Eisenbacteria bacterium]